NRRARCWSRAATAVTVNPGTCRAGLSNAAGVIRAAPSIPIRNRSTTTSLSPASPHRDPMPAAEGGLGLDGAPGGYFVQRDASGHASVERLGPGRDGDADQHVAA